MPFFLFQPSETENIKLSVSSIADV